MRLRSRIVSGTLGVIALVGVVLGIGLAGSTPPPRPAPVAARTSSVTFECHGGRISLMQSNALIRYILREAFCHVRRTELGHGTGEVSIPARFVP
jgi:hypothetical protein